MTASAVNSAFCKSPWPKSMENWTVPLFSACGSGPWYHLVMALDVTFVELKSRIKSAAILCKVGGLLKTNGKQQTSGWHSAGTTWQPAPPPGAALAQPFLT